MAGLNKIEESVTRKFLDPEPVARRELRTATQWLELRGINLHNLVDVEAKFPLGVLSSVTGVSGSGKSSLVTGALARRWRGS